MIFGDGGRHFRSVAKIIFNRQFEARRSWLELIQKLPTKCGQAYRITELRRGIPITAVYNLDRRAHE
jgi:hypothetical protein